MKYFGSIFDQKFLLDVSILPITYICTINTHDTINNIEEVA